MSFILDAMTRRQVLRGPKTGALFQGSDPPPRRHLSAWSLAGLALVLVCIVATGVAYVHRLPKPLANHSRTLGAAPPVAPQERLAAQSPATSASPKDTRSVVKFRPPTSLAEPLPTPGPVAPGAGAGAGAGAPPIPLVPDGPDDVKPPSSLSTEVRTALLRLTIRAHVHASQRKHRFIIVGNRQLREGDELLPAVRIDEITPTGLVLRHKNTRIASPALVGQNFVGGTSTEP